MQLAQAAGFEGDKAAAGDGFALVLESAVDEGGVARQLAGRARGDVLGADGTVEDVGAGDGDLVEDGSVEAKVVGNDVAGGMRDPVVDVERGAWGGQSLSTRVCNNIGQSLGAEETALYPAYRLGRIYRDQQTPTIPPSLLSSPLRK